MGKQQLLLVVLVTIIIGLALVVAVNVTESTAVNQNRLAIRQEMLQAAAMAQALWERPEILSGAGQNFSARFTEEELLAALNIAGIWDEGHIRNEHAVYRVDEVYEDGFILSANPARISQRKVMSVQRDQESRRWHVRFGDDENNQMD